MTNLTSEQFRDILHNLEGHTIETPNVQTLLRRAVETFYRNFGCYPEVGSASPGCGSIFGEQTQFDGGMTFAIPLPMATVVVGRKVPGCRTTVVTTADVGKPHKVSFGLSECPLRPSGPTWVNLVKGVLAVYCCNRTVTAFEAAVESSLPLGVGFGSSAALEVATIAFLEILFGTRVDPVERAIACQLAEKEFLDRTVGVAARLCASTAKDRSAVLIDTITHHVNWVPFRNKQVVFVAIDPHLRDTLFGKEYFDNSKFLKKACNILQVDSLRGLTIDDLVTLGERIRDGIKTQTEEDQTGEELTERRTLLDEHWNEEQLWLVEKRTRFYITEMERIEEAGKVWSQGDVEMFGQKMVESHNSLKEDFGFSNPLLEFFVEASLQAEGVLGSKMMGLGLDQGGWVMTLLYKENLQEYCKYIQTSFESHREELLKFLKEKEEKDLLEQMRAMEGEQGKAQNDDAASEKNLAAQQGISEEETALLQDSAAAEERAGAVKKKKKKCDPSAKRKKKMREENEWRLSEMEEQEKGNLRKLKNDQNAYSELEKDGEERGGQELTESIQEEVVKGTAEKTQEEEEGEGEKERERSLTKPSLYIVNAIAGAKMMFTLKTDLMRSRYAVRIPQAKELVRNAMDKVNDKFGLKPEAIGLAPATTTLFGEFLEYNMGYVINAALPLLTVVVGGRNDSTTYRITTTSTEVGEITEFRAPVPCTGTSDVCSPTSSWINHAVGTIAEFKGHVPGFVAVVESSVPCEVGVHSCSAFQASIYEFLQGLTRTCTADLLEKAERCRQAENRLSHLADPLQSKCTILRFIPTFFCREGYVLLINSKNLKMAHYYLDHPSYAFLIACCKERSSTLTLEDLGDRVEMCEKAAEVLGKDSLVNADERHLRCLRKRGAPEEMIKRARYIISEQERCIKAIKFIREEEYENLGALMTQSHCSLRDDFEVSCPEVELVVKLALSVEGVLGAKLVGRGLTSTVLILSTLSSVDKCIKHVRRNYIPKRDKPFFFVFRPSSGAFTMSLEDSSLIP